MYRLILLMIGVGEIDAGKPIEGNNAIGLGVVDLRSLGSLLQRFMVLMLVTQRPGQLTPENFQIDPAIEKAEPIAPACRRRPEVARAVKLLMHPGAPVLLLVALKDAIAAIAGSEGFGGALGCQHASLPRGVTALDLAHVERAGRTAKEQPAPEDQLPHRLEAPLVQGPCTIGHAPPPFQHGTDRRMGLEALELLKGRKVRILIVQTDDEADIGL